MAGFTVVEVETDSRGMVNIEKLKEIVNDNTAGLMQRTLILGLFKEQILTISQIIHNAGGLLYYDGANLTQLLEHQDQVIWVLILFIQIYVKHLLLLTVVVDWDLDLLL